MVEPRHTDRTYRYELLRAVASGILETAGSTFLLLIAVWFGAGPLAKGFVAGAGSLGLLLSPLVVSFVTAAGARTSIAASRVQARRAASYGLGDQLPGLLPYERSSMVAMASAAAIIPRLTQTYQENSPERERGRRFSRTVMIRIATAAFFSKGAGDALAGRM